MTSRKTCVNGCAAAPQYPSLVLCRPCLDRLNAKMKEMASYPILREVVKP